MTKSICSGAAKAAFFTFRCVLFFFLCTVFAGVSPVLANIPGNVTFSWRANPPEDNVIGYRLYYGAYSRFNASGAPKANFSYDYYIDFTDQLRCEANNEATFCQELKPEELQCQHLYDDVPICTISNQHGQLYFALTAYNAQSESGFTRELHSMVNPEGLASVRQAAITLLLNK